MMKPVLLLALLLVACASSKSSTGDPSTIGKGIDVETMRPQEAAQVIREFQQAYDLPPEPPPEAAVTSMAEVLEIIRADRLWAFDAARRFAAGRQGPDALTVRAYLDLSSADALRTAASILEEERRQDMTELRQLLQPRPLQDPEAAKQDAAAATKLRAKTEDLRKVVRALQVLSESPLQSGFDLAEQAIRQDPNSQLAYLASANYHRLRRNWLEYDRMMRYADEGAEDPPVRTFLRAMEALERYADPARAEALLRETLVKRPDFVRAQANLVLVSETADQKHAELEKLERVSPNHLVVRLAGPMIKEEYETTRELRGTR
jgi:hypothetical protein